MPTIAIIGAGPGLGLSNRPRLRTPRLRRRPHRPHPDHPRHPRRPARPGRHHRTGLRRRHPRPRRTPPSTPRGNGEVRADRRARVLTRPARRSPPTGDSRGGRSHGPEHPAAAGVLPARRDHRRRRGSALHDRPRRRHTAVHHRGRVVHPDPQMGNVNAAVAALRNWAINLHTTLQPMGISTPRTSQSACTSTPAPRRPLPTASPSSTVTPTPPAPAPNTSTHPRPRGHRALSRTPSRRRDSTARDRRRPARTSRDCQRGCRRWLLRYRGGRLYEHRVRSSVAVSSRLTSRPTLSPQVAYPRPAVTNVSRSSSQLLQCWSKERTTRPRRR